MQKQHGHLTSTAASSTTPCCLQIAFGIAAGGRCRRLVDSKLLAVAVVAAGLELVIAIKVVVVIRLLQCQFAQWHFPLPLLGRFTTKLAAITTAEDSGPSVAITVDFTKSYHPDSPYPAALN